MRQIIRVALFLDVGAFIGGIIGSIFTGDWVYTIVWAVALSSVFVLAGFLGGTGGIGASQLQAARARGIIGSLPGLRQRGDRVVASQAVLNPEPTLVEPRPTMLNGVPIESTEPTVTAAPVGMPPPSGKQPGWKRALSILIIVIGVAITLIPAYRMIAWTATDLAQGRFDGKDMRTGLHQQEAIDDIAEVVGGYIFLNVYFYDEYVIVAAPTYPGADTIDIYMWQYGRAWREGPDLIQPSAALPEVLFDASRIDFSIVGQLVNDSKADTGWTDFVSWYPSVSRLPGEGPEINISLSTLYYSGYYRYSVTGELLDRSGSGLD